MKKFFLKTFGCAQNLADSEKIKGYFWQQGYTETKKIDEATVVIINSCVIRESAENRVYGLIDKIKEKRIIVTGCLVPIKKEKIEGVEMWPISRFAKFAPLREKRATALIPIGSGCDNFCSYCIVPYARGREVSRPGEDILAEVDEAIKNGFKEVLLIGQNVNSWNENQFYRLLDEVAQKKLAKVSFVSSNPWDFSDKLIEVIAKNKNIDRLIHLPCQSGDDEILKRMNRNYTAKSYLDLIEKIRAKVAGVQFSTDIIIGFPGESEAAFENTVKLCQKVGFTKAYLNKYSPRKGTVSAKLYQNDVPMAEKKRRWQKLEKLINVTE